MCQYHFHAKCNNRVNNATATRSFYCGKCLSSCLPFQSLSNDEFFDLNSISVDYLLSNFNSDVDLDFENTACDNSDPALYYEYSELNNVFSPDDNDFSVIHVNIVSLIRNFHKLEPLFCAMEKFPDVIAISETRLKDFHMDTDIPSIEGYEFIRNDSNLTVGGVGIYIKNTIDYKITNDFQLNTPACQDIWIEVKFSRKETAIISAVYRHPRQNFQEFQTNMLKSIDKVNKKKRYPYIYLAT